MWNSLRFRLLLTLITVVVVVVGTVAALASRAMTLEFQRYVESGGLLRDRRLQGMLVAHYEHNGSWEGVQPAATDRGLTLRAELPAVDADPARVAEVLQNLLTNAIGYTPPGGQISVLARAVGREVEVRVRDSRIASPPRTCPMSLSAFTAWTSPARALRAARAWGSPL